MRGTWTRRRSMKEYTVMMIMTLVVLIQTRLTPMTVTNTSIHVCVCVQQQYTLYYI